MSLRNKLLAGYLIFVAALVVLGGWSAWRLREMGGVSRRIISENYDSVVAAQDMKESLERQDSAALFALLGQREKAFAQLQEHRTRFDAAFEKAANNITEPGEAGMIETIRRRRAAYYKLFDQLLAETDMPADLLNKDGTVARRAAPGETRGPAIYFQSLEPAFNELRADCHSLLLLNQRAMLAKSEAAAGVAQLWFYRTLLIAGLLVAAGLLLAFFLANRIVEPLRQLTATTARMAGGDLNAKVVVNSRDEVGVLAAEYNRMAERIRQLRTSDLGKLLVKNPNGWEREVVVEIPDEVINDVARQTRHHLPSESSFWSSRAEHVLATYLWEEGKIPSERLKVADLDPDELRMAAQWEG